MPVDCHNKQNDARTPLVTMKFPSTNNELMLKCMHDAKAFSSDYQCVLITECCLQKGFVLNEYPVISRKLDYSQPFWEKKGKTAIAF